MNQSKRNTDDLQYDLCVGCAKRTAEGRGILAMLEHLCPINTVIYRPRSFKMRHFQQLITGKSDMDCFTQLFIFPYFKKMGNYETATESERRIYGFCRDTEISAMNRLRAYIELEEEFSARY